MFPADFFARREHVRSVFWTLFIKGVALFYVTLCFVPFLVYVSCMFSFFLRPFCKSLKLFFSKPAFFLFLLFFFSTCFTSLHKNEDK